VKEARPLTDDMIKPSISMETIDLPGINDAAVMDIVDPSALVKTIDLDQDLLAISLDSRYEVLV